MARLATRLTLLVFPLVLATGVVASQTTRRADSPAAAPAARTPTDTAFVPYPADYRDWTHVKSTLISPSHARFAAVGGFQHFYANAKAMIGYRTRNFPEGSVVVVDWIGMQDVNGAFLAGPRYQIDVMVRDSVRYAASGGWGFQRFVKDSPTERAAAPTPQQCHACHAAQGTDGLVISTYQK